MLYTASVAERVITLDKTEFHQDAVGVDFVDLSLDSEWDGAEFTVIVFYRGRTSRGTSEICGKRLWYGEPVDVPPEALTEAGDLRLTVLGVWPDGDRIVTCEMEDGGEVCWSGAHDVDWTVEPGEDAIDALIRMVKASAAAAEEAAQSAEEATATADAVSKRLDLIANSDDETLDQLAEFAEFVKENRDLIENLDPLPKGGSDGQVLTLVEGAAAWAEPQGVDWNAADGEPGSIANKPVIVGAAGTGANAEVFNGLDASRASGAYSHAEGENTEALYEASHAEGFGTRANSLYSHAEGYNTTTYMGTGAHAEGGESNAAGNYAHAEGYDTTASGAYAHAEGYSTIANASTTHAEGAYCSASCTYGHAEGYNTSVGTSASAGHAEGYGSKANGTASHAEGYYTIASASYQHTQGRYNVEDKSNEYAHIVGNGTNTANRKNIHTLDWSGIGWYSGTVLVGGTSQADAAEVATKAYVDGKPVIGDTWHTASVALDGSGMAFVGDVPSPHNDGGDALTMNVDVSGSWSGDAAAGRLSMRFGDGSSAPVVDGVCRVPREAMVLGGTELTIQAVASNGVESTDVLTVVDNGKHPSAFMWTGSDGHTAYFSTLTPDVKVGDILEVEMSGKTFSGEVYGGTNRLYAGDKDGFASSNDAWYFEFGTDDAGNVMQGFFLYMHRGFVNRGDALTLRRIREPRETVSNTLTVPLQQGEPGMFTYVKDGKVKRLRDVFEGGGYLSEDSVLAAVVACGLVSPAGDKDGNLYTDGDGAVFVI